MLRLKDTDPQLKVLLAVGGYTAGSAGFEAISASSVQRQLFADNAVSFLRQHGFDGLDVDWEYPSSSYKTHFTQLLQVTTTMAAGYVDTYNMHDLFSLLTSFGVCQNRENRGANSHQLMQRANIHHLFSCLAVAAIDFSKLEYMAGLSHV